MKRVFILLSFMTLIVLGGCGEKETPQEIVIRDYLIKEGEVNVDCAMKELKEKLSNEEIITLSKISSDESSSPYELFNNEKIVSTLMYISFVCPKN